MHNLCYNNVPMTTVSTQCTAICGQQQKKQFAQNHYDAVQITRKIHSFCHKIIIAALMICKLKIWTTCTYYVSQFCIREFLL